MADKILSDEEVKSLVKDCGLNHIAVIMDGNRRWAKTHNLPSAMGHKKGVDALKATMRACDDFGIKYLTVYAFSTENWNRTSEEVSFLMDLLANTLKSQLQEMHENGIRIRFIGDISALSEKLQKITAESEKKTENNQGVNLQIAFNYGARDEIKNAVKRIIQKNIPAEEITEDLISENLYTKDIPDPEILVRTGGEKRISNYLLWQIAYSEIITVPEFWPEFNKQSLTNCVLEFQSRKRRFGK